MSGKWLELLKEAATQVERVGLMVYPETPTSVHFFKVAQALAPALKIKPSRARCALAQWLAGRRPIDVAVGQPRGNGEPPLAR